MRLCVDGPVLDAAELRGRRRDRLLRHRLAHPVRQRLGHVRRARGAARLRRRALEAFPFAAFVSKTITLEPRQGNPPPRLWELPGRAWSTRSGCRTRGCAASWPRTCPRLAELPVPLIVNVMGSSPEEFARLVDAFASATRSPRSSSTSRARTSRPALLMGADPGETAAAARTRAAADRQAADREADAELRLAGRRGGRGRAARRRRGVARQHAARDGDRPARPGRPWLGGGTGGPVGARRPRGGARAGARGARARRAPDRRHGRRGVGA